MKPQVARLGAFHAPDGVKELGLMFCLVFLQGLAELVHTGGGLGAASDAAETVQDEIDIHAFDHGGDGLEIALAPAAEIDVVDAAVVDDEVDFLGADIRFGNKVLYLSAAARNRDHRGRLVMCIIHCI